MEFSDDANDFNAYLKRAKCVAINYMSLRAAAKLSFKLVERWLKIIFTKENARQLQCVQFVAKCFGVDEGCTENFEWPRCATALRNICPFDQTQPGIDRRGLECRYVRR